MKKLIAIVALTASFAASAFAYSNLSATSNIDTVLAAYKPFTSDAFFNPTLNPGSTFDSGNWTANKAALQAILTNPSIKDRPAASKVIFLGETAGYFNDVITTSPNATIFSSMQSIAPGINIKFADYVDAGVTSPTFDLLLRTEAGNTFSAFTSPNVTYRVQSYTVKEQLTIAGVTKLWDVTTFVLGFEDISPAGDNGRFGHITPDYDYNDLVLALQFFRDDGTPITPVPESSTYGLIGAAGLLGLVLVRRFKSKK